MRAGGVAQVVECLPRKSKDLSSNPTTAKKSFLSIKIKNEKLVVFCFTNEHVAQLSWKHFCLHTFRTHPSKYDGRKEKALK
jgi:hypothetical protein